MTQFFNYFYHLLLIIHTPALTMSIILFNSHLITQMKKGELYRVCLKSGTFQEIPTFRVKIGKAQKKINPYFIPSDKQRYNCDSILQRHDQEPHLTLSVFFGYKFIGSGTLAFNKPEMPNERLQIFNRDKQSIACVDVSLVKINKVVQVPALDISIKKLDFDDLGPKDMTGTPFVVLKYGELNYQTEKQPIYDSDQDYIFNEYFKFPQSEMQRIITEIWCQVNGINKFLGVSLIYLREKEDINKEVTFDVSYMSKKRGSVTIGIFQDKKKEAKVKDYSNAPKRTIKTTVVEALMLNPIKRGTYIKLIVGKQSFQTTALFIEEKMLKWNQAFTMQANSQKQELQAFICFKNEKEQILGRSFLQISKIANRTYQLTFLDDNQIDIGKVYLQFYDHQLFSKERKTIPKDLADKIAADLASIQNRYRSKQPLHEYMQELHVVLQEGLLKISKTKPQNPLRELGLFLVSYKKD